MTVQWTKPTDVDPPAVSLHQQQNKHMQWNKVDDENITTPCRDLWEMEKEISWKYLQILRKASAGFIHTDGLTRKHKPHLDKQSELLVIPSEYFSIFIIKNETKQKTHNYKTPTYQSTKYQSTKDFWNGLVDFPGFPSWISSSSQANLVTLAKKNMMLGALRHGEVCSTRQWYDSHIGSKILLWHPALAPCTFCWVSISGQRGERQHSTSLGAELEQSSLCRLQCKERNKRKEVDAQQS